MPAPTFIQQDPASQRKSALAQLLLQQGTQTSPIQSPWQGVARIAQALSGAGIYKNLQDEYKQRESNYSDTLAKALTASKPWTNPDTGQSMGPAGGVEGMMAALSANPDTAPLALQTKLAQVGQEQSLANAIKLAQEKQKLEPPKTRTIKKDGNEITQEFDPSTRTWTDIATSGIGELSPQAQAQKEALAKLNADLKAKTQGKYYAVNTGQGLIMVDKGSGMAVRLGLDQSGNMAQMGQPFKPMLDTNGQPTVVPEGAQIGSQQTISPLLPPSVDPNAQGAVAGAKTTAQMQAKRTMEAPVAAGKTAMNIAPLDRMAQTAQELIDSPGLDRVTGLQSYLPNVTDEARNAQAKMDELKSQIAQNVLQMYRQMSQTGGAVGQVSNYEQQLFQNNLAALGQAQTTARFKDEMKKIIDFVKGSKERIARAYELQYGQKLPDVSRETPGIKFLGFE